MLLIRMSSRTAVWGLLRAAAVAALFFGGETALGAATFEGLGDLPGGVIFSEATGVSADGSVVVGNSASARGGEALIYDRSDGSLRGLGFLDGRLSFSQANGVSADGSTVVGQSLSAGAFEAFRYDTSTRTMTGLGDLPGGLDNFITAKDVSADGRLIVGHGQSASGQEAFVFDTAAGSMVGLGDLPGTNFSSEAYGISDGGVLVVGRGSSEFVGEAFVYDTDSRVLSGLGLLPDARPVFSAALAVSADGSVVVGNGSIPSNFNNTPVETEAFKYDTATAAFTRLGDLPGGDVFSRPWGVSADGGIVVGTSETESGPEAFIYDAAGGIQPVVSLLESMGLAGHLQGWTLTEARGVSADGLTIVGAGINPQGASEGWVAVVPEPGVAVIWIGTTGTFIRRRLQPKTR